MKIQDTSLNTQQDNPKIKKRKAWLSIGEIVIFPMLGAVMFCSKIIMELLPNIHLLGMFTITYTLVFRKKALIPIYIYVLLNGLYAGFSTWWVPYLYIWTILWAITMLLPKKMPKKIKWIVYPAVCGIHGFAFGTLYAPAQAIMWGLNAKQMIAWIVAGLPWDVLHGVGNLFAGLLIIPLSELLLKLTKKSKLFYIT